MKLRFLPLLLWSVWSLRALAQEPSPIRFDMGFSGASLGRVEVSEGDHFRLHVQGQQNAEGRNRQPTWYSFRMDGVRGRKLTLTLTDFLGEYNNKPACAMSGELRPMYSTDGQKWQHFTEAVWNDEAKEMTVMVTPPGDSLWVAHIQPYTHEQLLALLQELVPRTCVRQEVYGQTVEGRPLHLLTVTDFSTPLEHRPCVWLQARQHAWEAGTSWTMEGALRFITSDDPAAVALRRRVIFKFTPMVDPDGTMHGRVRFNGHGFDVNRRWKEMDLQSPTLLQQMPEIWYTKKAILAAHREQPIALLINLHNTETAEYLDTQVDAAPAADIFTEVFQRLRAETRFDPSRVPLLGPTSGAGSTNDLWTEAKVPVALMELRIGPSAKLGRLLTAEDRVAFGRELITVMGEVAGAAR